MRLNPEYGGKGQIRVLPSWDLTGGPAGKALRFCCRGTGSSPGSGVKTLPAVRRGQGNRNSRTKQKVSVAVAPEPAVPGGCSGLGAEARKRKVSFRFHLISLLDVLLKYGCVAAAAAASPQACPTLCDPETAARQSPPCLGFSRQEHWRAVPFPSPMHASEK